MVAATGCKKKGIWACDCYRRSGLAFGLSFCGKVFLHCNCNTHVLVYCCGRISTMITQNVLFSCCISIVPFICKGIRARIGLNRSWYARFKYGQIWLYLFSENGHEKFNQAIKFTTLRSKCSNTASPCLNWQILLISAAMYTVTEWRCLSSVTTPVHNSPK
jgi:hypothetical protein